MRTNRTRSLPNAKFNPAKDKCFKWWDTQQQFARVKIDFFFIKGSPPQD